MHNSRAIVPENTQESSNAGNATSPSESMASNTGNEQQESNNTGNATSTGAPENATSPSGSTANNTASPSESMVNSRYLEMHSRATILEMDLRHRRVAILEMHDRRIMVLKMPYMACPAHITQTSHALRRPNH